MEILLAESAGFCFGVNRAMDTIYDNIDKSDAVIYTLGPIIHNQQVVSNLQQKGVQVIQEVNEVQDSEARLIIRTHGIAKEVYDLLDFKNITYIDATCPYVKKIHNIVEKHYHEGYQIIIIGDPKHPEVQGINGWCENTAIICSNLEYIKNVESANDKLCIVAQTTIQKETWLEVKEYIHSKYSNAIFFDTICNATNLRQLEAASIAKQVEIMFVIGGKHSSNTGKLADICKAYCQSTYHIETFEDIPNDIELAEKKIGITAGASTPAWIIKEVINKMTEKEQAQDYQKEMSFEEAFEESLVTLNTGDVVKGSIIGISNNEAYVDLGFKSDGIIAMDELTDNFSENNDNAVKIGDEVEAIVVRVNDGEGNVLLSKKKLDLMKGWSAIEEAYKDHTVLKGKVSQVVNGGVIASVNNIRVFIPASHLSDKYVSDLNEYLKRVVSLKIIDVNSKRKKVVGSIKAVIQEENIKKAKELWGSIEVGKQYRGTVKKLTKFGAFVDIGGVDGLIHISELSWTKIKHPSEVLKEGDVAEVYIIDFDKESNRISLGFKKAEDNPWETVKSKFNVDDIVECKVVRLVPFGAFVELVPGVDGLIHISQISNRRIGKPEDVLKVGQKVEAKIMELNVESQKINLSIRELLPIESHEVKRDVSDDENDKDKDIPTEYVEEAKVTIGDALAQKNTDK